MHFLFIAGVGKTHQPPHDLQLKNCIKTNIYFLFYNVNIFLKIMSKKYYFVFNPSAAHKVEAVEKGSEFRFLASGSCTIVPPPSKKRKTPKVPQTRCLRYFYNPSECDKSHPPPFTQGRHNSVNYILACFRSFCRFKALD